MYRLSLLLILLLVGCRSHADLAIERHTYFEGQLIRGIVIEGPFRVDVIASKTTGMSVSASSYLLPMIEMTLINDIINVKLRSELPIVDGTTLQLSICPTTMDVIGLTNAAQCDLLNDFSSDRDIDISISRASILRVKNIKCQDATISLDEASMLKVSGMLSIDGLMELNLNKASTVTISELQVCSSAEYKLYSASNLTIGSGTDMAIYHTNTIHLDGASSIEAAGYKMYGVDIISKGASQAMLYMNHDINAKLVEASNLEYREGERVVFKTLDIDSGSKITKLNF